jgi:hypothetical protein
MKGEWVAAERVEEVRAAAEGWRRAGAVDAGAFGEISRRYPEPRLLPSPLFRALVFLFVSLALLLLLASFAFGARRSVGAVTAVFLVFAGACVALAEVQESTPRLALRGGAGATSFWGIVFFLVGSFLLTEETLKVHVGTSLSLLVAFSAASWALAAWRWGSPVHAGLAAVSLFLLLARASPGRLLWVACGAALVLAFERFLDRPSWAPSHRRCAAVLVAVGAVGVYAAVNYYSLDHGLVEDLRDAGRGSHGATFGEGIASVILTALVPLAVLARGIRSRRTFLIDTGLVLAALSFVTLRNYVHLAATWLVLAFAGGLLVLVALLLNRWLARGRRGERGGFTAEPLFADERRLGALELVPVVAAHAPGTRPAAEADFQGGGGSFGGGGAGGSF